jgi:drug/metabolite transporter (DMT)-like permease
MVERVAGRHGRGDERRRSDWDPDLEPDPRARADRKGRTMLYALILFSVIVAAIAQLTLKHGMNEVVTRGGHSVPLDLGQPVTAARRVLSNVWVWAGLLIFVVSAASWVVVLSKTSLSFAYPFVSITYVVILLFDGWVLHEGVPGLRWLGVALIIAGIFVVSTTHTPSTG